MARFRLFDLNPEQLKAVTTTEGALLILAGAGTGKTRVITARVAYMISQGTPPEEILAVTFTNKAAKEMRERLSSMVEKAELKKVTMSTFHALCVRILRQDIDRLGYKKNFTIYDEADQSGLVKKIITRLLAKDERLEPNLAKSMISKAKNMGCSAPPSDQTLIGAVFAKYQQELKNLNAVDFDDLLLLAVKLLNEDAEACERWSARFKYVMVDEFQDTNGLQMELVTLLAGNSPNVCVVGDDDQSIYGWRGADVSNILEFEQHFKNPTIVKLEQNYRSTNRILTTANSIIQNNPKRRPKSLWSEHGDGEMVRLIQMPDDREEALYVTEDIKRRNFAEAIPWEKFAVLYRMNAQSRLIEENLRRMQIPYQLVGGKSFFDRREVKDLLSYANCLLNPDDDVSLLRIINTPARGIGASTVERALEFSIETKTSVFRALQSEQFQGTLSARTAGAIKEFADLLDGYETRLAEPLADYASIMSALVEEVGYKEELRRSCKTPEEFLKRESNLFDILNDMAAHKGRSDTSLKGFLDEVSLDQEREEEDKDKKKGVTLITLHAAKGLEFQNVYLLGLEEGVIPHERSKLEGTIDEERRLLYVGITRAMRSLTISYCLHRIKFGTPMPCHPSTFIKEFPPETIERLDFAQMLKAPVEAETAKSRFAQMRAALGMG